MELFYYVLLIMLLLLLLSLTQIFFLELCSQTLSVYVLPMMGND
jgi:hypothetical protein